MYPDQALRGILQHFLKSSESQCLSIFRMLQANFPVPRSGFPNLATILLPAMSFFSNYPLTMTTFRKLLLSVTTLFPVASLCAQDMAESANLTAAGIERRQYHTSHIGEQGIKLDGIHDDPAWLAVEWATDFYEHAPDNGGQPAQRTSFKILQDNKFLYLAFRAYDTSPDSIVARLGRRDEFAGDWVEINIDSYHDLRTAFSFTLSVSGVRNDEFVSNDGNNWDPNWNPVWEASTVIDSLGWSAEARIPFSQLRYGNQEDPVWGIQVMRRLFRKEERSTWQPIAQSTNGWVSHFGELRGLTDLPTSKQIELAPYVVAQTEKFEAEPGNPFADGSRSKITGGLDGKFSVTRDLILDFTINPDFGQVEADPGAVRLDGYEIFFEERRPFFQESRNLFDLNITGSVAGGSYDSDLLFYSRRIGGAPHIFPTLSDGEFAETPSFSSIIGAAKFSGKTKDGISIGVLESITESEYANIALGDSRREQLVEPRTNYFVGRIIKDFSQGKTILGGMLTAVNRQEGIDILHRNAYSGAIDFQHNWKNRWWSFRLNLLMSRVDGTPESILQTQTNFVHLFQRSDADHLIVDPTKTTLTGTGGTIKIGKYGGRQNQNGGIYKFETGVTWRSPELEMNDIGFLLSSDEINHFAWGSYNLLAPFSVFNSAGFNYNHWARWDFGGQFLYSAFNTNTNLNFKNYWGIGAGFTYNPLEISNNALRGASALRKPPGYGLDFWFNSDTRKKFTFSGSTSFGGAYEKAVQFFNVSAGVQFQPFNALRFSLSPGYQRFIRTHDQFVANVSFDGQTRSIVSYNSSRSFSLSMRANYYIRPNLSLQYYGQPFIFRALYKDYGFVENALGKTVGERFHQFTPGEISIDGGLATVDENGDGSTDYTFGLPDFNFIQFRSNLVLRWEYVAGSEIFLVWSQGVVPNAFDDLHTPLLESLTDNVFDQEAHNIFLVKLSYRFLR